MDALECSQDSAYDPYETWSSIPSGRSSRDGSVEDTNDAQNRMQGRATPASVFADSPPVSQLYPRPPLQSQPVLPFLPLARWTKDAAYAQDPPDYIQYAVEWKLSLNGRVTAKDTEQDVVFSPRDFWNISLQQELSKVLKRNKFCQADETTIVVAITERLERDLVKRFDELNVDWTLIEKQMQSWSHLLRFGKRLRISIWFKYVTTDAPGDVRGQKRARTTGSATQTMLSQRALQLDAEQESTSRPSIWRHVYNLMRCPGPPCKMGPHCWIDPVGKRHYKLKTHHLTELIKHVDTGNSLETHDDVPEAVRQQLYTEEQQKQGLEHQKNASLAKPPPINITNVLPESSAQAVAASSEIGTLRRPFVRLGIPGP
ncbi:hypothetical protein F5Y16DRAFT_153261 [Xylariaceae sp. FL0255]|nr:hypothetical protein F5Y16DRAFT_153261 [Xylariaceae sp. FL0255]